MATNNSKLGMMTDPNPRFPQGGLLEGWRLTRSVSGHVFDKEKYSLWHIRKSTCILKS